MKLTDLLISCGVRASAREIVTECARPLVVTRHSGLIAHIRELGLIGADAQVFEHVTNPDAVFGRVVIGVLPLRLACLALAVVEVPLELTAADREAGDLPVERVRQIAGAPVVYTVRRLGQLS